MVIPKSLLLLKKVNLYCRRKTVWFISFGRADMSALPGCIGFEPVTCLFRQISGTVEGVMTEESK